MTKSLRNIAIIAHVDHGKTTLIDNLLKQSGLFRDNQHVDERIMDSGDLEKERGITILAKPTSVVWKDTRINIIDTPGHADFGGEVERILGMTDGVILLVDAAEGPMPQTKFVLSKALAQGLRPIVVINKVDRSDARSKDVINEIFDLFVALDANDQQLDFPVLYASGRDGWCNYELDQPRENLHPLLDLILNHVPEPDVDLSKPFAMLSTLLHSDSFLGRCLIGRVVHGIAKVNDTVKALNLENEKVEDGRLTKLFTFSGTTKVATAITKIAVNTHLAGAAGTVAGAVVSRIHGGKTDVIMMLNGALAGLVAITAEPLTPSPIAAMIIGSIGAVIMYFGTKMLENFGLDDVVGAIPVHMFAGIFGTLVVPFTNGDTSFATQFTGVLSVCIFSFVLSLGIFKALSATTGLRISKEAEKLGTDKAEIGVVAYAIRD
jgi:GTP-binding protein TypA/BipA